MKEIKPAFSSMPAISIGSLEKRSEQSHKKMIYYDTNKRINNMFEDGGKQSKEFSKVVFWIFWIILTAFCQKK